MKVLMITSEAVPFIKSGGLADVVTALSQSLIALGHDVKIILPYYHDMRSLSTEVLPWDLQITVGDVQEHLRIRRTYLGRLECLFVDAPCFSERAGIYGSSSHEPYADNLYRFTLFSHAVFDMCRKSNWYPDLFHCHDWTTGFIPRMLKEQTSRLLKDSRSVFTIHNLGYQGDYSKHDIHIAGLDAAAISSDPAERTYSSRLNMLKIGLTFSDLITTVSPTYAQEIQTQHMGHGLDGLLRERRDSLYGILNGVDYDQWDPQTDTYIPFPYSADSLELKARNKQALQEYCNLTEDQTIPVIGMVSRLADQKGFRELCSGSPSALERILIELPVQIIIVGTGEKDIEEYLKKIGTMYDNFSAQIVFNNYIAHLVEAGSDMFLMPSRYEPCGLNQIYSLKYGTLPIIRNTGGLADTVTTLHNDYKEGEGFSFDEMSGEAIYDAVKDSLLFWDQPNELITEVRRRAMKKVFSWDEAAELYSAVYTDALNKGREI
ncbi:MAG: glycogen synthase [Spirochaetia bacterium]|nr:glycogen synthase [Spirochaetia bacterium]